VSVVAVVLVGLVAAGLVAVLRSSSGIPVVSDVRAAVDGSTVVFTWNDPGIADGDAYVVSVDGSPWPPQREPSLTVPAEAGDRVCVTVTVARDGKSGAPSAERCSDVDGVP
jgi:hypothetical protein